MKAFYLIALLLILFSVSCIQYNAELSNKSENIHYMGRINHTDSCSYFYWSGTSASINITGGSVSAIIRDETGDNYYNAILNNDSIVMIRPSAEKDTILLFDGLKKGEHNIKLFKRTEYNRGHSQFYGFLVNAGKVLPADPVKEKKIEFYGNSITAGYGVEDFSGNDSPDSIFTNNYLTYAALTARHFDAEYHCICKSGIGITISWFPTIMPEIYDRVDPRDSTSSWNFSKYTPDLVVIDLMQNDSWLVNMPDHPSFKHFFGTEKPSEEFIIKAYRNFIKELRNRYPEASILCTLGSMDATKEGSEWPGYVEKAVEKLQDNKIYTYFMPFKDTPGHPRVEEQAVMAEGLIEFIEKNIK